jgi:hypothetical protein
MNEQRRIWAQGQLPAAHGRARMGGEKEGGREKGKENESDAHTDRVDYKVLTRHP